jgi:hypothetical protein
MMAACAQQEACEGCKWEGECNYSGEFRLKPLPRVIGVCTPIKPIGN